MKVIVLLFTLSFNLFAQEISIPALTDPVVDLANLLSSEEENNLSALCRKLYESEGPQVSILLVQNLQGHTIEDFSIRVAEKWKLGSREKDNGLLIVVSKEERKVRIEVGGGIEGEITDYESSLIIKKILTPYFKSAQFYIGLEQTLLEIASEFEIELTNDQNQKITKRGSSNSETFENFLPLAIFALIMVHLFFSRSKGLRGIFSGLSISGLGYMLIPGIGLGIFIFFLIGAVLGFIGLNNLLYLIASSSHSGGYSSGSGSSWSSNDSWSGGGGDFSGGGSSGDW